MQTRDSDYLEVAALTKDSSLNFHRDSELLEWNPILKKRESSCHLKVQTSESSFLLLMSDLALSLSMLTSLAALNCISVLFIHEDLDVAIVDTNPS